MTKRLLPFRLGRLLLLASIWAWSAFAQDEPDPEEGGPEPANPPVEPGEDKDPEPVGDGPANGDGEFSDNAFRNRDLSQLTEDLAKQGFEVPLTAFEIFPETVRGEIQSLVAELLPLLEQGKEQELSQFFDDQGHRIATVFDQLGLQPKADALLADPASGGTIKFPDEFDDYDAYLDSLDLQPFEREFMLQSHRIAERYEDDLLAARNDGSKIQSALETYREKLETLNERYAEQFREQFLESIDRAGADGRRPDVDR